MTEVMVTLTPAGTKEASHLVSVCVCVCVDRLTLLLLTYITMSPPPPFVAGVINVTPVNQEGRRRAAKAERMRPFKSWPSAGEGMGMVVVVVVVLVV